MMDSMQQMFAVINARLDQTKNNREDGETSYNQPPRGYTGRAFTGPLQTGSVGSGGTYLRRMVNLDFPKFNGKEDPTSWVCRADQFFEFHHTPEEHRVPLASFNLEGDAQLWYQLMKEEGGIDSWDTFKSNLHARYGPTQFQDFFDDLTKLQQTGVWCEIIKLNLSNC
ncbi:hypothetical protein AMTRI_Chr11g156520 [Amborella trichopoda]